MTAFHDIDDHIGQLRAIAPSLETGDEKSLEALDKLARAVVRTIKGSEDGSLAVVHLFNRYARPVELALYHAVLCHVLGTRMELPEEQLMALIKAALTVNIPFWELQDELNIQTAALTDEQRTEVLAHPEKAVAMLQQLGVQDEHWLRIAREHHERPDGKGYPQGLQGDQIEPMALILHIAESYCAAITDRDYRVVKNRRKRYHATSVLHEFHKLGQETELSLLGLLIKTIGVYPPGTWVRLQSNEVALVVRRQESANRPIVAAFGRIGHPPLPRPISRDTSISDYRVVAISAPPKQRAMIHLSSLWASE